MSNDGLDVDGQPFNLGFNAHRRLERDVSELLGLAKGLLADGEVTPGEAQLLHAWVASHPDARAVWPCSVIADRLKKIYADGAVSEEERADLAGLLRDLVGGKAGMIAGQNAASTLPVDQPPPALVFPERVFVLTGTFAMGNRPACEKLIRQAGGWPEPNVTLRTNYLVIGTFASRDWVHTSHGRKIEKAVEYRTAGRPVAIVCEDHWAAGLPSADDGAGSDKPITPEGW